jgi:hypothetical protein
MLGSNILRLPNPEHGGKTKGEITRERMKGVKVSGARQMVQ